MASTTGWLVDPLGLLNRRRLLIRSRRPEMLNTRVDRQTEPLEVVGVLDPAVERTGDQHPPDPKDAAEECRQDRDKCFPGLDRFGLGRGRVQYPDVTDRTGLDQGHLLLAVQERDEDFLVHGRVAGQSEDLLLCRRQVVDPGLQLRFLVIQPRAW